MSINEFWTKLKTALHSGVNKILVWFNLYVTPELAVFLEDNKGLAIDFCLEAAKKYAAQPGHFKAESVGRMLKDHFAENHPDIKVRNHWISLLIEIAVAVLKAQGKI